MIAIINVSEEYGEGLQKYEVLINKELITTFTHTYEDGLSECLRRAAWAVDGARVSQRLEKYNELIELERSVRSGADGK